MWRLEEAAAGPPRITSHTGRPAEELRSSWLDENGRLFLDTELGLGLVHTLDMGAAANAVEAGLWQPQEMRFADMPARFGFILQPQALPRP